MISSSRQTRWAIEIHFLFIQSWFIECSMANVPSKPPFGRKKSIKKAFFERFEDWHKVASSYRSQWAIEQNFSFSQSWENRFLYHYISWGRRHAPAPFPTNKKIWRRQVPQHCYDMQKKLWDIIEIYIDIEISVCKIGWTKNQDQYTKMIVMTSRRCRDKKILKKSFALSIFSTKRVIFCTS